MSPQALRKSRLKVVPEKETVEREFNRLERYMLMRFHPRKVIYDVIGMTWAVYFLWNGNWQAAVAAVVVSSVIGLYFVRLADPIKMADTVMGRLARLHLDLRNWVIQLLGLIPLISGIWSHSTEMILAGLSIVALGHFFCWSKVNPGFRLGKPQLE